MSHAAVAHVRSDLKLLGEGNSFQETICEMLGNSNFFSDLDHNEIEMLAKWVKAYSASAGSIIFQEGNKDACLCVLAKGEIAILKETAPNESKKIAKIRPGRTIGEMSVVDGYPFSASAIASKNSVILLMTQTNFKNLIEQNGKLGVKLLLKIAKIISLRLRQTTGQLVDFIDIEN